MSDVLVTQAGPILEVLFNRPDKKNALTGAMYAAVAEAFRHANADASVRVVLLSGAGDTFTSGNDIKDFQSRVATDGSTHASPFLAALSSLTPPLVAAVNGAAIGVGTTMLAHADLVVAARSARFAMPFTSLGLVPEAASSLLFPRLVGHQRASALLLLGETFDAETALSWGLVNQVVADEKSDDNRSWHCRKVGRIAADRCAADQEPDKERTRRSARTYRGRIGVVPRPVVLPRSGGGIRGVHGEAKAGFFQVCLRASTP